MNDRMVTTPWTQLTPGAYRAMLACGLWMRAAFIGASAAAIGAIQLFEGEWSALSALFTVAAGVGLTLLSWRRAQAALSDMDKPPATATVPGATPAAAHR